ncbi:hypothetical protein LPJ57_004813 [Coemansia sp. RSA 486]|nr:hypothetical protein LPJ57_004813 [Coemansia sp. RSA 486]KAJ2229444.1 hypothetical protein IWW45_006193 [Coemansia sp. RSA 485]KAJ2602064.1 hypothetical protein GGF39_000893 [Coemansia sp. RSA 1721]
MALADSNSHFVPRRGFQAGLNVDTLAYALFALVSWPPFPVLTAALALTRNTLHSALPLLLLSLLSLLLLAYLYLAHYPTRPIDWSQHTVVVTGGSHGIGLSLLHLLAATPARLAVIDVRPLPDSAPTNARLYRCDLSDACAVEATVACIKNDLGPVTMLVNNAGIVCPQLFADHSPADVHRVLSVNALAPMLLTQGFLSDMLRQPHAHLIYVSSVLAFIGVPQVSSYCASKAAVASFAESLRMELGCRMDAKHVRVSTVFPSMVDSGMFAGIKMPRWLSPRMQTEDVAEWIFWLMHYGRNADIYMPLYASLAPMYFALPNFVRRMLHWVAGSIDSMRTFRGHGREPSISM